jgi:hypothetical protein
MDLLGQVDDQMPKDIGISIGGRRLRIQNTIAKLTAAPVQGEHAAMYPASRRHEKYITGIA